MQTKRSTYFNHKLRKSDFQGFLKSSKVESGSVPGQFVSENSLSYAVVYFQDFFFLYK